MKMITLQYLALLAQNVEDPLLIKIQFHILFYVKGGMKLVKEPLLKKDCIAKCYNGFSHKIIKVSNIYDEVSKYDSTGACAADLEEFEAFEDAIFVAAKNISDGQYYVFCCSRNSTILGD